MTSVDAIVSEVLSRPARGRKPALVAGAVVRELVAGDVARLADLPAGLGSDARPLQRLRHSHHMLAQLLAGGTKQEECALITGYDPQYISNIQKDPAFANLLAHYASQVEAVSIDVATRLRAVGIDSIDELQSRLATEPEALSNRELMDLAELAFDRSGHGPTSNVNLDARHALVSLDTITRIKDAARLDNAGKIRELPSSHDFAPAVGTLDGQEPMAAHARLEGSEGSGHPLPAENRETSA